jgi:hypothetical protein
LYVAPASIQDTLLRVQVIGAASEVIWGKKGEIKGPKKPVPGIQSVAGRQKETEKEARPVPGGGTRRLERSALDTVMKAMSSWCPISEVVVKRSITLKILDHSPWSIWPYLPPQSNGASRGADRPGYNPKRGFKIQVLDGSNRPVRNEEVKIFTTFEEGSGGHGHKNGEKTLPQDKQGMFYWKGKSGNALIAKTDTLGVAAIDSLIASQVSGKFLVTASLKANASTKDTVNLQLSVPGLVEFGTGDYWSLSGTSTSEGQNHPSNHWCTQPTKDSLTKALKRFYEWSESPEGGGKAIKLAINDMSLQWGGVFDIYGKWNLNKEHSFHRVGLSIDIDNAGLKEADPKNPKQKILTRRGQELERMIKDFGVSLYDEGPIHYSFEKGK